MQILKTLKRNTIDRLFKSEQKAEITEGVDPSIFEDWELWEQKWTQRKINRIWRKKVRERVWRQDKAYELVAEYCAKHGQTVLDIGSGGGIQYAAIHEYHPEMDYTGMDITPKMLHVARKLFPNVKFDWGDAAEMQYDDDQFDVAFLRHVLEHHPIQNAQSILHEALRVAKNAVLILFFIEPQDLEQDVIVKQKESGFYLNTYSRRWLEQEIEGETGGNFALEIIQIPKTKESPALYDQALWVIAKK